VPRMCLGRGRWRRYLPMRLRRQWMGFMYAARGGLS
jgi:hypothetical protein